jgi:hypothetical protein
MLALFRLVAGRRILVLVLLAALAAVGTPALRETAARLLACGVSLQASDLFGGSGAALVDALPGRRLSRSSSLQCLREATRASAAAQTWMRRRTRAP